MDDNWICLHRSLGSRSIVTYKPMTELDYGTLLCWARNKIGEQRVPCVYHIIAAGDTCIALSWF